MLGRHLEYRDAVAAVTAVQPPAPVEVPVSTRITWRRRVPAVAASVAAGIAVLAGATPIHAASRGNHPQCRSRDERDRGHRRRGHGDVGSDVGY